MDGLRPTPSSSSSRKSYTPRRQRLASATLAVLLTSRTPQAAAGSPARAHNETRQPADVAANASWVDAADVQASAASAWNTASSLLKSATEPEASQEIANSSSSKCSVECMAPLTGLANGRKSPFVVYGNAFIDDLRQVEFQALVGLVAVAIGAASAWNGPMIWRTLFTAATAGFCACVARREVLELAPNRFSEWLFMAQVAACVGFAVHTGFDGFQVLLGACLGAVAAYGLGNWARTVDHSLHGVALFWYELGAVAGLLLYSVWRERMLAVLAPLLGSFLIASGFGVVASRTAASIGTQQVDVVILALPPSDASWVETASMILGEAGVTAFATHCGLAMGSAMIHALTRQRLPALLCLVSGVIIAAVAGPTGLGCTVLGVGDHLDECPPWLRPSSDRWRWWPLSGGLLWAFLAAAAAWRQLTFLNVPEPQQEPATPYAEPRYLSTGVYTAVPSATPARECLPSVEEGGVGDALMSTLPSGITAPPALHGVGKSSQDSSRDFVTMMPRGTHVPDDLLDDGGNLGITSWLSRRVFKLRGLAERG